MALGLGGAFAIKTGADFVGSLLKHKGRKEGQRLFDMSLEELQSLRGKPAFDVGGIANAQRRNLIPKARQHGERIARRFNFDQPKAQQFFVNKVLEDEASILPGLMEREGTERTRRDLMIQRAIAELRSRQLG